jgi:hypothetical protein
MPARACGGGEGWRGLVEHHELGLEDGGSVLFPLSASYHVYTPHKQRGITRIDFGSDLV